MARFVIERDIPGAGDLSREELDEIVDRSCQAMEALGVDYTWVESYVVNDKFYCIHEAEDEETIRRHAQEGGFPVDRVSKVKAIIGPHTTD